MRPIKYWAVCKCIAALLFSGFLVPSAALAANGKDLDGSTQAYIINNPNTGSTTWSVTFRVKWDALGCDAGVVVFGDGGGRGFAINSADSGCAGSDQLYVMSFVPALQSGAVTAVTTGTEYYITVTHSGTSTKVYRNISSASATTTDTLDSPVIQNSTDDIYIGKPIAGDPYGGTRVDGKVAEIGIWDVELTAAEVLSIHNQSTCFTAVQSAHLKEALVGTNGIPMADTSTNAFTVSNDGSAPSDYAFSGTACTSGSTTNAAKASLLGVGN